MSTEFFNDQWRIPSNENQNKISNYSMDFDGTSDFIDCGDSDKFSFGDGATDRPFSLSGWVKPDSLTKFKLFGKLNSSNTNYEYQFGTSSSKVLTLTLYSEGASTIGRIQRSYNTALTSLDWQHWVATYDGSGDPDNIKIYINGVQVGDTSTTTGTYTAMQNTAAPFLIASESVNYVNGKIDQVTIFDYELSPIQVASLGLDGYAFNFPNRANPAAQTIFLNNQAQVFNNATNFSFSGWFKIDYNENQNIFDIKSGSNKRFQINYYSSTQGLRINIDTSGAGNYADRQNVISNGYIAFGEWFHYAGVFDGSGVTNADRVKLYINGQPVTLYYNGTQATSLGAIGATNTIKIGQSINNTFRGFRGDAGNIQMWDASLLPSEVTTLYNNGKPLYTGTQPQASNMQFWYKLDGSQDTFNGSQWTLKDNGIVGQDALSSGMTSSNLIASDINGELVANPMITSPKPIAYYQLGDQSVSTGPTSDYLVPNNSLSDYVFNFGDGYADSLVNFGTTTANFDRTDPYTFSIWIKASSNATNQYVISKQIPPYQGYIILLDSSMKIGAVLGRTLSNRIYFVSNSAIPSNEWVHLVWTYSGNGSYSGMSLYINGAPFATTMVDDALTSSTTNSGQLNISGRDGSFHREVHGELSNFSIFDTELSSTQITTLYNNGAPGDISSLSPTHWYKLDASEVYNSTSTEWSVDNNVYPSVYKSSLNFDGSSNYIDCGNDSSLSPTSELSVSAWVNNTGVGTGTFPCIISNTSASANNGGFVLSKNSNKWKFYLDTTGSSGWAVAESNVTVVSDSWQHLCVTWDGSTVTMYLNGQPQTTTASASQIVYNADTETIIGEYAGSYFGGGISNTAIFNTSLTSTQVNTLYNNGTPEASISHSPVSWWKLDNITTGIQDSAGSNDGTNNGATEYAGFVNELAGESLGMTSANLVVSDLQQTSGYSPYALDFDGIDDRLNCGNDISLQITGAMTISYWVKGTSTNGAAGVGTLETLSNPGYILGPATDNTVRFNIALTSSTTKNVATTQQITTTEWHHIVGVYTPSVSMKIYIDGQLSKTETSSIPSSQYAGGNNFMIGYRPCCKIDGQISNVAVWNTDLSSSEINEIYNEGVPGNLHNFSGTAPVSWWQIGSNSSYYSGSSNPRWTCLDEIGTNNAVSAGSMTNNDIVDGPGYSASGLGTSSIDIIGDAPYSTANGLSENMNVLDRTTDVPS